MLSKEKFAKRLKELMEFDRPVTPIALATALGVNKDTVYNYLNKKFTPRASALLKLCKFFNCSSDYLLGLKDDTPQNFREVVSIAGALTTAIQESGKSKYSIQKYCKIAPSDMHFWLTGKGDPTAYSLVKLAEYLEISVDALLGREL